MRVLIAPQSFKGSLSAKQVAEAIQHGLPAGCEAELLPMADGGEGTVDALLSALGGRRRTTVVKDPLGRPVKATWARLGDGRGVVEMAAASGLPLLRDSELDPARASTYGTGQLIAAALESGAPEILIGLGGSATNDGGAFALEALGARLLDSSGKGLPRSVIDLRRLQALDLAALNRKLQEVPLRAMSDVTNPLLGPNGASAIYGPQKGLKPAVRPQIESALQHWADVVERTIGKALRDKPGAGAAGGLGFALLAIGATLEPGADLILDAANFDERVKTADLVITGEGRLDGQSVFGKASVAVARRAKEAGVPVLAMVGSLGKGYEAAHKEGITAVQTITSEPMSVEQAQKDASKLITAATERAFRMMAVRISQ